MEDTDSDVGEREPKVTSEDPNERKLARKLRIQRRLEAARKQKQELGTDKSEEELLNPVQQQILQSYELLEKYIIQGDEYITNVRVANDSKEVDRREREGLGREKIINDLEDEARLAQEKFNEIADKWGEILQYNDPLHINDGIIQQKELGKELIAQKDGLIASLKLELRHAERVFGEDQRKQVEDITILSQRIEKQVMFMRVMYNKELEAIENVMIAERDKLIEESRKRWEELYKRRDEEEVRNADEREESSQNFLKSLKRLRIDFQEAYRSTKIRIEREIEELQKELESIKALTLLNNEKLDYNYQILKKREDENLRIKSQQKRRINKLRDVVIFWRNKIKEYTINSQNQIAKLESDIKKLNVCVLEVESKADYFAQINDRKFDQILRMNKADAEKVLSRIMEVDRILHVQQMGIPWSSFENNLRFFAYEKIKNKTIQEVAIDKSVSAVSLTSTHGEDLGLHRKNAAQIDKLINEEPGGSPAYCALVKKILNMVADQTGFLAEEKLLEILKPYTNTQKTVVGIDNTFEALGVHKKEEVDLLVQYFLPFTICLVCQSESVSRNVSIAGHSISGKGSFSKVEEDRISTAPRSSISMVVYAKSVEFSEVALITCIQENDKVYEEVLMDNILEDEIDALSEISKSEKASLPAEQDLESGLSKTARFKEILLDTEMGVQLQDDDKFTVCTLNHPLSISPAHVVKALKQFVSAFYSGTNQIVKKTMADRLAHKRETSSRLLPMEELRKFWQRYISAFPNEKRQLWNALFAGLKKYHSILKERRNLSMEVVELRKQNMELKQILSNYMHHSKIMDPPCGEPQAFHKGGKLKCLEKLRKT